MQDTGVDCQTNIKKVLQSAQMQTTYLEIYNVFPFQIFLIQDFQFHGLKFLRTKVSVYSKENYNFSIKIIEIHALKEKNDTFESIMFRTLGSMKDGKITWSQMSATFRSVACYML